MKNILILFFICLSTITTTKTIIAQSIPNNTPQYIIKFLDADLDEKSLIQKLNTLGFIASFKVEETDSYIVFDKEYTSKQVIGLLDKSNIKYDKVEFESKNNKTLKLSDNYFFPQYINTGNEKLDEENYEIAKTNWINNHPLEFEKIKHLDLDKLSGKE